MVAITAITQISTERICLNPSEGICVDGILAANYVPGTAVVLIAGVWTTADNDTGSHKLMKWGVVGYKKRVNQSTGALIDIETAWDTSETGEMRVPIWTDGFCIVKMTDPAAPLPGGTGLMVSATAGELITTDGAQMDYGTAAQIGVSGDVFIVAAIGKFMGRMWGGHN